MPSEGNNLLKQNQGQNLIKLPFLIYVDSEAILEKASSCENNPEISHMAEINNHTACVSFIFAIFTNDKSKNKQ